MATSNPSSPNENFIFKCHQHAASISEKLLKFYQEKDFFDTLLIADNNCIKIQAHKIVLSALSDYFWELFHGTPATSKTNEVRLENIKASSLKLIIDFMYSGSIELNLEKIEELLRSAVFLKMKNLVDGCCEYLEKNLNNNDCLYWLRLAKDLRLNGLQEKSSNFIYTNFEEVIKQPEFLLLSKMELKDLLFNDNTHEDLEEEVFLGLVTWINYEKEERQHLIPELLSMVRYQFLTPKFIIQNRKSVCKTMEICELVYGWLQYHLWPESRTIEQQNFTFNSQAEPMKEVHLHELDLVAFININSEDEVEIHCYNQILEKWYIEKRSRPFLTKKLTDYSSMIVIDDKLFIVGGICKDNKISNGVLCVDLKTFKLTDLPPMRIARYRSQLANLNGHLCVFGGFAERNYEGFVNTVEIFNSSTGKWSDLQPLFDLDKGNQIVGHNGILYIFDFRYGCLQCYDVSSNQWTSIKQPIDDSVKDFRIAAVGNFVYAICIVNDYKLENCSHKKTVVKRLDLSNNTWSVVAELPKNQSLIHMVAVVGNKIFIIKDNYLNVEYNIETNEFTSLIDLPYKNVCFLPLKL